MGRRKIEIQPITHERNRAVTFLKRKNGLFKKAYELGVLCSVDVAVIIFEERPGHQLKLYQYCSGDVNGIVQRHLQFDGERDTKTPHDFSGTKGEDAADDEDEIEEEDTKPKKEKSSSKASNSKPKDLSAAASGNMIVPILPAQSQSPMQTDIPRQTSLPTPPETRASALPISNDRLTSEQSSRNDSISSLGGGINLPLPLPLNMPPNKRARLEEASVVPPPGLTFPYRLDVDLSTYPPAAHATSLPPHAPSHASHPAAGLSLPFPHNAMGLMGMQNSNPFAQSIPPFDLSGRSIPYPQLSRSYNATLENLFGSRPTSGSQSQATNMLLDLLNSTGGNLNLNSQPPPASFPAFEWPVTAPTQPQNQSEAHGSVGSSSGTGGGSNESASWLEFLTSATGTPPVGLGGLPTPTNRTPSSSVSSAPSFDTIRATSPTRKRHRDDGSDSERSMSTSR